MTDAEQLLQDCADHIREPERDVFRNAHAWARPERPVSEYWDSWTYYKRTGMVPKFVTDYCRLKLKEVA